ncbi:MAG TPA: VCBS repeat-containing protein [Acidimicrobiales bacterium]|nr:VCBS repeat-containing protein [Acidimicrobiales bacterium]
MGLAGGKRLGVAGVAIASLALASCINFAPAVSSQASTVEGARSVATVFADVTGDGSDDVLVAVSLPGADAVVRMAPCGGGCLERREQVQPGDDVLDLAASDFDGDGVADVSVVTSTGARVYFGGAATKRRPEGLVADDFVVAAVPELEAWSRVVAGDFDDDGDADIGLSSRQLYDFVAGDGRGGFAPLVNVVLLPSRASMGGLASGDVDGDGDPEVLVTESGLGASNILGTVVAFRDGTAAVASYTEDGLLLGGVTAADVNGDHLDDVAVVRFVPDPINFRDVRLLRSTGTGFTGFGSGGALTSLPSPAADMVLRDIDLDGNVDFLASDGAQLSWWHGLGTGAFTARVDRAAGPAPRSPAFGTVGGGARADLVVANSSAPFAQVSYLTNASQL